MNRTTAAVLALLAAAPGGQAAPQDNAVPMAGEWNVQTPGQPPAPAGVISLHGTKSGALMGTFTPPRARAVSLAGVQVSGERLTFWFTLTGGKPRRAFKGRFTPTLDADTWTGRLSGPTGSRPVDLVRRR